MPMVVGIMAKVHVRDKFISVHYQRWCGLWPKFTIVKRDRKSSYLSIINALLFLLLSSSPEMAGCRRAGLLLRGSCWGRVFTGICGLTEVCRLDKGRAGCGVFGFWGGFEVVRGVRETSVPLGRLGICGGGCWLLSFSPFSFLMSITSGCSSSASSSST